jgi:mRNA-decapping enzyme subunit 2
VFAEKGLEEVDPHAFRVVGGGFLNSGIQSLETPPDTSRLQPLFRRNDSGGEELQPFFSEEGATPWGEIVKEATTTTAGDPAAQKHQKKKKTQEKGFQKKDSKLEVQPTIVGTSTDDNDVFMTDAEITQKSQALKTTTKKNRWQLSYERDMEYINRWVANLPKPPRTKHFDEFKLDVDAIMVGVEAAISGALKKKKKESAV